MRKRLILWSAAALGLALLTPAALAELKPGDKAPEFSLKDLKGKTIKLSQFRGKSPVLVNFFATW
jgi:hypothetical protein